MLLDLDPLTIGQKLIHNGHGISPIIHDSLDASLNQTFGAHEARKCRDIASAAICLCPSSFDYGIFFGVDAYALIKALTCRRVGVTPITASLVTILVIKRGAIITCSYDPIIDNNYRPNCPLHAIGP